MSTLWVTSDHHFGHANIIKLANRPFDDVKQMNEALVTYWNETVRPDDIVYHLGDFSWKNDCDEWLQKLNGHVRSFAGNHDRARWIDRSMDYVKLVVNERWVILFHYPISDWDGRYGGSIHCHGHVHQTMPFNSHHNRFNVCVERTDYRPVNLETLAKTGSDI